MNEPSSSGSKVQRLYSFFSVSNVRLFPVAPDVRYLVAVSVVRLPSSITGNSDVR